MRLLTPAVAIAGLFLASPAMAGVTLQPINPKVAVNHGQGYKQVATATEVSIGDKVMVGAGGHGKLVYPNGCTIDVYQGRVMAVPEKCYKPMRAGLEAPVEEARPPYWLYGGIAAGIAVGICAASGCFDDDDRPPPPPPRSP
jgi:hypothetical protein